MGMRLAYMWPEVCGKFSFMLQDVCELPANSGYASAPPKRPKLATSESEGKEAAGAVPLGDEGLRQEQER